MRHILHLERLHVVCPRRWHLSQLGFQLNLRWYRQPLGFVELIFVGMPVNVVLIGVDFIVLNIYIIIVLRSALSLFRVLYIIQVRMPSFFQMFWLIFPIDYQLVFVVEVAGLCHKVVFYSE